MVVNVKRTHLTTGTILVVDDDRASLLMLEDLLSLSGFTVLIAEEGRQGIEMFVSNSPDLVITDIRMPDVDGLELLRKIRELDSLTPVILVTGHGDLDNAMRALRRGAYDFIFKPVNPEVLSMQLAKESIIVGSNDFERDYRRLLEDQVEERTRRTGSSQRVSEEAPGVLHFCPGQTCRVS